MIIVYTALLFGSVMGSKCSLDIGKAYSYLSSARIGIKDATFDCTGSENAA